MAATFSPHEYRPSRWKGCNYSQKLQRVALTCSRQFTKAQMRTFFHTMKALTSYHVSATLIVIENRNNGLQNLATLPCFRIFERQSFAAGVRSPLKQIKSNHLLTEHT